MSLNSSAFVRVGSAIQLGKKSFKKNLEYWDESLEHLSSLEFELISLMPLGCDNLFGGSTIESSEGFLFLLTLVFSFFTIIPENLKLIHILLYNLNNLKPHLAIYIWSISGEFLAVVNLFHE